MTVPLGAATASTRRALIGLLATVVVGAVLVMGTTRPAAAHVDLVESDPANVATVESPVSTIRLTFSAAADPVVDEFELRAADGSAVAIDSVRNDGENVLVVTPSRPPDPGRTRLTWAIRSGDSHTMTGTIGFTVTVAAPTDSTNSTDADVDAALDEAATVATGGSSGPSRGPADIVAAMGRWLVYLSLLLCVGGLAYLAGVHRGSVAEGRRLVFLVRRAAVLVVVGSVVEWLAQLVVFDAGDGTALWTPSTWLDVAGSGFGRGTALRLVGALLVLLFFKMDLERDGDRGPLGDGGTLTAADDRDRAPTGGLAVAARTTHAIARVQVAASPLALVGAVALVLSEAFIGHTASTDPRLLVVLSDAVHMAAGGTWAAGAFLLALTLAGRRARGEQLDARLLASRFSVLAAWTLGAVAITGVALAWSILGGVDALWSTEFGRLLSAKVAVVGVVAAIGAHNHRVLVPALVADEDGSGERFRRAVSIEAALFGLVLLITAGLVASSPT